MESREKLDNYVFEGRVAYEKARAEDEAIQQIRSKADVGNAKTALKLYNKLVSEKMFTTVIGYHFLEELRNVIVTSDIADTEILPEIPLPADYHEEEEGEQKRSGLSFYEERYKKMYEGQVLLNKKIKIAIVALVVLIIGFVFINFKFEYSIFTYFTNYKANMEEELLDKYTEWESELEQREQDLEKQEAAAGGQQGTADDKSEGSGS